MLSVPPPPLPAAAPLSASTPPSVSATAPLPLSAGAPLPLSAAFFPVRHTSANENAADLCPSRPSAFPRSWTGGDLDRHVYLFRRSSWMLGLWSLASSWGTAENSVRINTGGGVRRQWGGGMGTGPGMRRNVRVNQTLWGGSQSVRSSGGGS